MKASITFHSVPVALCVELSQPLLQIVSYVMCFLGLEYFLVGNILKKQCIPDINPNIRIFFIIHQLKHGFTL